MDWRIDFKKILVLAALFSFTSCTKSNDSGSVRISLPKTGAFKAGAMSAPVKASGDWAAVVPSDINDIDCYAIFVGGPDSKLQGSSCASEDGTQKFAFGPHIGFVAAGGSTVLPDIPSGSDRVIYVMGVKMIAGSCENNMPRSHEFTFANYSSPYLLGKVATRIEPGVENKVVVPIEGTFNSSTKIDECSFFAGGGGTPSLNYFNIAKIALGDMHACAVSTNGFVKCWGSNSFGQLGQGHTNSLGLTAATSGNAILPVNLGTGLMAADVVAGLGFSCARLVDGRVKCWGKGTNGQLGIGSTVNIGDSAGEMGDALPFVNLGTGRTAKKLSAGHAHVCAILDDDSLKCWGQGSSKQLGDGLSGNLGDGPGEMGDSLAVVGIGTVVDVAAGQDFTCAVATSPTGAVKCWGGNSAGQLGTGDATARSSPVYNGISSGAVKVHANALHTCVTMSDGTAKCWGMNNYGQIGDGTSGTDILTPAIVSGLSSTVSLGLGVTHSCAIDNTNVYCWGRNLSGELGTDNTTGYVSMQTIATSFSPLPVSIHGGRSAAKPFTCTRFADGRAKCWGDNSAGQLGIGNLTSVGGNAGDMSAIPFVNLGDQPL